MKVLIVDDSKVCRMLYRKELTKGGYETVEAVDGLQALTIVQEQPVDLVILDIEMPHMDGYQVCKRLRSEEFTERFYQEQSKENLLPVIFVTSNKSLEGRVKGFNMGATDYITKGFKPGALLSTVDNILKPANPIRGLKLLLADNSRFMRQMVTRFLEDQEVNIIEAATGEEAFNIIYQRSRDIKAVLIDNHLPDMTGSELCHKIRKELGLRGIPLIVMTSDGERDQLLGLFKAGITDYLVKPFEKDDILARLRASVETVRGMEQEIEARMGNTEDWAKVAPPDLTQMEEYTKMASTLLHNIGNVLNSVHVSCNQMHSQFKKSKLPQLVLAQKLICDHRDDLVRFFQEDKRGKLLPEYLDKCGSVVEQEHVNLSRDIEEMVTKVQLMKDIIEVQQSTAKGARNLVPFDFNKLVNETLKVQQSHLRDEGVELVLSLDAKNQVAVQGTAMTHVLINLVKNAVEAMKGMPVKRLTIQTKDMADLVIFTISDTGAGVAPENMARVFSHGFTTKSYGHGFGLSYCRKMTEDMGGSLSLASEGEGKGAVFTIEMKALVNAPQ